MIDFWLRADAVARIMAIHVAVHVIPPKHLLHLIDRARLFRYRSLSSRRRRMLFSWCVRLAARTSRNPCLVHALAFHWMDRDSRFHLGVSRRSDDLQAHAWVESDGETFSSVPLTTYAPLFAPGDLEPR